ncbi:hypothetical protein B0H12DRAFT_1323258 [Mycena haematopus]|nr:hypothetical protein B0H12DRAFT_1323258 [Mycena haematopus]
MFGNAIRRQARAALSVTLRPTATPSLLARLTRPTAATTISLRALSTTLVARYDAGGTTEPTRAPSRQLFVGNIAFDATEADVRDVAGQFGEVESVRLISNPDGSFRGFGYVTFLEQSAADRCLETGFEIYGRPARLDYSTPPGVSPATGTPRAAAPPGRVLFVGNMPFGTEEADLREKFSPFGPLKSIRIATRPGGEPRGFAHVEYLREEDAVAAYESFAEEPLYMLDRNLRVDYAPIRPSSKNPPSHKLYFYDYRGNEEALRTVLNEFETSIQRVYFLRSNLTGELTGSGFVEFMSVERATQVLTKLGGTVTPYGPLNLEYAINRQDGGRGGGGGGGGRGGGGGGNRGAQGGYGAGGGQGGYGGGQGGYGGGQGGYGGGGYGGGGRGGANPFAGGYGGGQRQGGGGGRGYGVGDY